MKKILVLFLCVITLQLYAQTNDSETHRKFKRLPDSIAQKVQQLGDSALRANPTVDSVPIARGLDELTTIVRKNNAAQKRKAILYIVLGVAGLIVLAIGLLRRTSKRK